MCTFWRSIFSVGCIILGCNFSPAIRIWRLTNGVLSLIVWVDFDRFWMVFHDGEIQVRDSSYIRTNTPISAHLTFTDWQESQVPGAWHSKSKSGCGVGRIRISSFVVRAFEPYQYPATQDLLVIVIRSGLHYNPTVEPKNEWEASTTIGPNWQEYVSWSASLSPNIVISVPVQSEYFPFRTSFSTDETMQIHKPPVRGPMVGKTEWITGSTYSGL